MEFKELVLDKLGLIFQGHGLHVAEQFKNYVKLKSDAVVIILSHDERDNSNTFEVGRSEDFLYPVNDNVVKEVFASDTVLSNVTSEDFVNNLVVFFEGVGSAIINGDAAALKAVENSVHKQSEEYTNQLVDKQNLDAANKAWQDGNYEKFIKYVDRISKQNLPSSFSLKYRMAQQKLK
jgi:hypothetical protein